MLFCHFIYQQPQECILGRFFLCLSIVGFAVLVTGIVFKFKKVHASG